MKNDVTQFYHNLGVQGLSNLLTDMSNQYYYDFVVSNIVPGNILDVGCGYGRISIPLIKAGFDVKGVDIIEEFVDHANRQSASENFIKGDVLNLPYSDSSFKNLICLWSTYSHFLYEENQVKALLEMYRVMDVGGVCIIDVPTPEIYNLPKLSEVKTSIPADNICQYTVNGIPNTDYVHDESTLIYLMQKVEIDNYVIKRVLIGDLPRLILMFYK